MVKHIVWWTLKAQAEDATARENAVKLKKMLENLKQLDCVEHMDVIIDFMDSSTEQVDILLQTTHKDADGLKEYACHPDHMEVADFVRKIVTSRKALDYTI